MHSLIRSTERVALDATPAARQMGNEIENPPEPYRGPDGPGESWAMRILAGMFAVAVC